MSTGPGDEADPSGTVDGGPDPAAAGAPRGSELLRAVAVMDALRSPGGDAWSAQQTHASLARYLLEESHEVLEALAEGRTDRDGPLVDELGDLLFQILFHSRLGQEQDPAWDVDDVARSFVEKMHRRNPHVFASDATEVLADREDVDRIIAQWHEAKRAEGHDRGVHGGIPHDLPSLQRAGKVVHRARSAGRNEELLAAADDAAAEMAADPDLGAPAAATARALLDLVVGAEARDEDPESLLRTLLARMADRDGRGTG